MEFENIKSSITDLSNVPVGINKNGLDIACLDLMNSLGTIITSNRISYTSNFVKSFLTVLKNISNVNVIVLDPKAELKLDKSSFPNYFTENLNDYTDELIKYFKDVNNNDIKSVLLIYGLDRYLNNIDDGKINSLISSVKNLENVRIVVVDDVIKIKNYQFIDWFQKSFDVNGGLWIGQGVSEQNLIRLVSMNKEMTKRLENDMGYIISESRAKLCKLIDFDLEKSD